MTQNPLFGQIRELSHEAIACLEQQDLAKVTAILDDRLSLLKRLSEQVLPSDDEDSKSMFRELLLECQASDNQQIEKLMAQRSQALSDGQTQNKIKHALNAYQKFDRC